MCFYIPIATLMLMHGNDGLFGLEMVDKSICGEDDEISENNVSPLNLINCIIG